MIPAKRSRALRIALTALFALIASNLFVLTWPSLPDAEGHDMKVTATSKPFPRVGYLKSNSKQFDALVAPGMKLEVLAAGFEWTEGPVWHSKLNSVLFSDIPNNAVFRWQETPIGGDLDLFLMPAGYSGARQRGGEIGSNGLILDPDGRLVLCQHGDRRMARLDGHLYTTLVDKYQGKRLNSPNDATYHSNGDLYFTDPPYGLEHRMDDPEKDLDFQGVYRLSKKGELTLLTREMTRPNGIAFSPDEKKLYVANSDPKLAIWKVFDVREDGTITGGKVLYDVTPLVGKLKGLPDGMAVDHKGNLFATGPGGVMVLSPEGKLLGSIFTGQATANCTFGGDGSVLYVTADMYFCRIQTQTRGAGF